MTSLRRRWYVWRLQSPDPAVRTRAAEALGHLGDPLATVHLIMAQASFTCRAWDSVESCEKASAAAAAALKQLAVGNRTQVIDGYVEVLFRRGLGGHVHGIAISGVVDLAATEAIGALIASVAEYPAAVAHALQQLGGVPDELFRAHLASVVHAAASYSGLRHPAIASIEFLAATGDPRSIEPLIAKMTHPCYEVRNAADAALRRLGKVQLVEETRAAESRVKDLIMAKVGDTDARTCICYDHIREALQLLSRDGDFAATYDPGESVWDDAPHTPQGGSYHWLRVPSVRIEPIETPTGLQAPGREQA
mgnify:CR=1 FL=1